MNIYAIIPAYNSSATIEQVIQDTRQQLPVKSIIVVDDGSHDKTAEISKKIGVIVLSHPVNRGKGAALKTGFAKALECGADVIFTLDADGQHQPQVFGEFLQVMRENTADIVIGNRMQSLKKMPFHRILSNRITSKLISLRIGYPIEDSQCGFRLLRSSVIRKVKLELNRFDLESELIIKAGLAGFHFGAVPIETIYHNQSSAIHHIRDTFRFVKLYFKSFFWS
jgi:glycosyltransferase involved in cell wall biosynthesis